jgi:hypothetical protein
MALFSWPIVSFGMGYFTRCKIANGHLYILPIDWKGVKNRANTCELDSYGLSQA